MADNLDPQDLQDPEKKKRVTAVDRMFPIEEPIKTHAQAQKEQALKTTQDRTGIVGSLQETQEWFGQKALTTISGLGIAKLASPSFAPDSQYQASTEFVETVGMTVPQDYQGYVFAAESAKEAQWRYNDIQQRMKVQANLAEYGFGAQVAGMLVDIFDPSLLVSFGVGAKVARAAMGAKTITAAEMAQARGVVNSRLRAAGITEAQFKADLEALIKATGRGQTIKLSDEFYSVVNSAKEAGRYYLTRPTLAESVITTAAGFGTAETVRAGLNPLIDDEDVLLAIGSGAVLGGGVFHPLGRFFRRIKQGPLPPPEYVGGASKGPWRPRLGGGYDGPAGPKGGGGSPSIIPPSPDGKMPTPEMFGLPAPHPKMRIPTHVPLEGPSGPSGPRRRLPQPASTHVFVIPPKGGESVIVPHAEVLNKETGEMELAPASDPRPMFKSWHVLNSLHPDTKIDGVLKALEKAQVSKSELAYVIKGRQTKEQLEDLAKLEDWIDWQLSGEPRSSIKLESFHLDTQSAIAVSKENAKLYEKHTGDDYFLKARQSWLGTKHAIMEAYEVHKQEVAKEYKPIEDAYTREREAHMAETINMFSGIFPETNIQVLRELVESSHVEKGVDMNTSAYLLMHTPRGDYSNIGTFKIYNDHPEAIRDLIDRSKNLSESEQAIFNKATARLFNIKFQQDGLDTFGMDSIAEIYRAEVEALNELYQPQQDRWVSRVREVEALHEARLVAKIGPVPEAPLEILRKAIENKGELTAQTLVKNYELPMIIIKSFLSPIESSITGEIRNLKNHLDYLRSERSTLRDSIQDEKLEIKIAEEKIRYGESQRANPDEEVTEDLMEAFGTPVQEALDIAEQRLSEQQDNLAHVELEIKSHTDELSIATANLERGVPYKGAEISKVVPYSDAKYKSLPVNVTVIEAPIVNWERHHSSEYDEDRNILGKQGLAWVRWSATDKVGRDTEVYENQNDQTGSEREILKEAEMDPERKMLVASISYQNAYANIIDMVSKGARRIKFAGAAEIRANSEGSNPSDWLYEDKLPTFYRKLAKAYDLKYTETEVLKDPFATYATFNKIRTEFSKRGLDAEKYLSLIVREKYQLAGTWAYDNLPSKIGIGHEDLVAESRTIGRNYRSFLETNEYPQRILRFTESEAKRFLDNSPRFLNPFVGTRSVVQKPAKALTPDELTIRELERLLPAEALDAIGFNLKFPREIMEQTMFQTVGADYAVPLRDDMGMAELKDIVTRENLGVTHRSRKGLRERITLAREKKTSMEWLESKPIPPQSTSFDDTLEWEFELARARHSLGDKVVDDTLARQAAERDIEGHIQRQAAVTQPDLRPAIVPQSVADNFPEITEETGFVIVPDGGLMAPTGGGEKPPTVPPTADGTTPPPPDPEPTLEPLPFEDVLKLMYEVIPAAGMENMRGGAKFAYSLSYLLGRRDGPASLRFLHHFALQTLIAPENLQGENVPVGIAADMKADSFTREELSKVGEEVQGLFDSWYTDNKHRFPFIGGDKAVRLRNAQEDFYRQVFEGLHGKPITDLRVQSSVDAFNKANARNAKKIHDSGMSETLLESEGYARHSWLTKVVGDKIRTNTLDEMTLLVRDGIISFNPEMKPRHALLIAKSLLINVNTRGLDVDYESTSGIGEESFAALERKLSAVPNITAEDIAEILSVTKKVPNKPSFLRNRLGIDIFASRSMLNKETGKMETVSIVDLLDTNAASLLVHQQRQLNGQLMYREMMKELAKFLGKPEATWDDLKELAKFEMLQRGENNAETMELIEHVQRIVLGIPIDPAQGKFGDYARILQKFSLAAFGATFGIAALAEGGQAVAMSSMESMMRMLPEMQAIMKDVFAGNMTKSELARELQNWAGIAHPKFGRGTNMNREFDHIAEDVQGMVESLLDFLGEQALSMGGLLAMDTMQRLWSAILFTDNLVNGVLAGGMPYSRIHLAQIGLTPDMAYRVVAMIKKHGKLYDAINGGKKIGRCHPENWEDVEAAESFRWALNLHSRRTIHEAMKGQYHHKFQGQVGRLFWQFRTFMLSAYEGQAVTAVQGMKDGDKRAAFGLLTNSMFAGLSYIAGTLVRYGHDEEKVKKYLTMEQIAKGMLVKSGWFTLGMPLLDTVQKFRGESPLFSYAHTNTGLASSALMGSPSIAIADALAGVAKSVVAPISNPNYRYSQQDWRNIETLAPLHGLLGWGNSLKMIGSRLPEKSKE